MKPDTTKKLTPEEEIAEFMADFDAPLVPTVQKADQQTSFENYRPAPEIAPGFYHITTKAKQTLWLPDLLQRDYEPPEPLVVFDDWGGQYVLLKPELLFDMVGNRDMQGYTTQLFKLGGGGYVNIYFNPDASCCANSQCIQALAYESLDDALAAMIRQAEADHSRIASNKVPDNSKAPDADGERSREVG
jgi:hypothetical protein